MKNTRRLILILSFIAVLLFILKITRQDKITTSSPTPESNVGIANPASKNCITLGGKLTITTTEDGGQLGICTLPGGKTCEEWSLFRGECD